MSDLLNSSDTKEVVWIPAKISSNKRIYTCIAGLVVGMFIAMVPLATNTVGVGVFFAILLLVMVGFFLGLIKWATTRVGLRIVQDGLEERTASNGSVRELKFSDFKEFAFMSDNRGNYWIRIKLATGGPMVRYAPTSIKVAKRQPFLDFGSALRRSVDAFNSGATKPSASLLESRVTQEPIKTGLNKSEKALNKGMQIFRIVWLLLVAFSGLVYVLAQPHPMQILGYVAIGAIVLFGIAWIVKKNKKK